MVDTPPTISMLIELGRIHFPIWQHLHPICSFTLWWCFPSICQLLLLGWDEILCYRFRLFHLNTTPPPTPQNNTHLKKRKKQWGDLPCPRRTGIAVVISVNLNQRWAGGNQDKEADVIWQNLSPAGTSWQVSAIGMAAMAWLCGTGTRGISGMGRAWEQRLQTAALETGLLCPERLRAGDCSVLICCTSENTGWLGDPAKGTGCQLACWDYWSRLSFELQGIGMRWGFTRQSLGREHSSLMWCRQI